MKIRAEGQNHSVTLPTPHRWGQNDKRGCKIGKWLDLLVFDHMAQIIFGKSTQNGQKLIAGTAALMRNIQGSDTRTPSS